MTELHLKKKIRLLHIVDNLDRGGTQTWLIILVKGLVKLGFEQHIYCLNEIFNPTIVQNLETSGAKVTIVGRPRLYTLIGLVQLYQKIWDWQPDIVQTILPFSDMLGRPLARLLGVPVIISSIQARNAHKPRVQFFFDRLTAPWADLFISVSRQAIPFAVGREGVPPEKVIYIANSIASDVPDCSRAGDIIRARLGIQPKTVVLGMIARLVSKKAHQDLLAAYAMVINRYPETVLILAGDGPLRSRLAQQVRQLGLESHVVFLGDRSDTFDLLAAMDLFVHPSLSEGMPHAVMEAMAAGLPVIASGVDGVQDLIINDESGWLVEPGNPAALADRIIFALNNQALWPHIGQAAAHRIAAEFSPHKMVMAYHRVFREMLARAKTEPT